MSKYTPGPWGCGKTPAGWYEVFPKQHNLICLATRIDHEADAYIIAAAPEMVELLDDVAMELGIINPILHPANGHVEALLERIDALLRRIEGEDGVHE